MEGQLNVEASFVMVGFEIKLLDNWFFIILGGGEGVRLFGSFGSLHLSRLSHHPHQHKGFLGFNRNVNRTSERL